MKLTYVTPTLESITVRGKYVIPETDFNVVAKTIVATLFPLGWTGGQKIGESIKLLCTKNKMSNKEWFKHIKEQIRPGVPLYLFLTAVEHLSNGILVEVECRPTMWYRISQLLDANFTENQVQEAISECRTFVKETMSMFKGKEVEPVSVYPIIQRTEIKSRLLNLGLEKVVNLLNEAEKHIVQNNFKETLKSSRTAFEKIIDWQMKKRGLEKTNNYKNDLDRLKSKGYLDPETTQLLQSYYHCLSVIGVHEKGSEPGIYEAQMGYGITLIMVDYFANKLP